MHTPNPPPLPFTLHPPKRLGHLGLIAGILQQAGILELLDDLCGRDPRMRVSHGECAQFLLLGVFAGEHGLWRLAERLDPYDLATLTGDPGVSLAEFHDVRLGRMLDAIWDAGVERLHSALALRIIAWSRLELGTLHFDTTSLSFYGAYEEDLDDQWAPELSPLLDPRQVQTRAPRVERNEDGDGRTAPVVTHGYAKNHRHDLKQVLFGMVVAGDGGVPLYGRAMDGNTSDITAAAEFFDHLRRELPDPRGQVFVADSKGWAPPTLECVRQHRLRLLSRLPRSTRLAREVASRLDLELATCLLKRYHHRRQRWAWVAYAGEDAEYSYVVEEPLLDERQQPQHDDSGKSLTRCVRHVLPVRVVACFSSELYRQKAETLGAIARREDARVADLARRLARRSHLCAADAQRELDALLAHQPFITCTLAGTVMKRELPQRRARRGRPAKGEPALAPQLRYAITLTSRPTDPAEQAARLRREATYILVRNRSDGWEIDDPQMVATYGKQWRIEHGFSWLKSGAAINPMFVQSPRRIQALCFLYTLALMIHTLIQRNLRRHLRQHGLALPYHRNQPSQNITARFTYELFRNVTTQIVEIGGHREKRLHGLDQWTRIAITGVEGSPKTYQPVLDQPR